VCLGQRGGGDGSPAEGAESGGGVDDREGGVGVSCRVGSRVGALGLGSLYSASDLLLLLLRGWRAGGAAPGVSSIIRAGGWRSCGGEGPLGSPGGRPRGAATPPPTHTQRQVREERTRNTGKVCRALACWPALRLGVVLSPRSINYNLS